MSASNSYGVGLVVLLDLEVVGIVVEKLGPIGFWYVQRREDFDAARARNVVVAPAGLAWRGDPLFVNGAFRWKNLREYGGKCLES